jgi:hypothetical protein
MNFETVKLWFGGWVEKRIGSCRVRAAVGFILGPIALVVALCLVYWMTRLLTHDQANNLGSSRTAFWVTLVLLPLLFVGNRLVPRRNLMEERMSEGPGYFSRSQTVRYFFMWILFTGPRCFDWALDSIREMKTWRSVDTHSCAAVLWLLLSRPRKVSYEDIQRDLDWVNLDVTLPELARIPGILFLKAPPPGLSLAQEFRDDAREGLVQLAAVCQSGEQVV